MPPTEPVYMVVVSDPVVALDLAEIIRDHSPVASVHFAQSREEADRILSGLDRLSVAILDGGLNGMDLGPLPERVVTLSGRMVVLHDMDPDRPLAPPTRYVRRPFTSSMILGALTDTAA